ncbi:MAG: 3-oxoacyl-[acyl-carrier-protein] reductase [Candidatus Altiarchaeota archaeon]
MLLEEKVMLVTGASRGIGAAIARRSAAEGANVVVNYFRSANDAKRVVKEIANSGGNAISVKADVSDLAQVRRMVAKTLKELGGVDVLVNNAGIVKDRTLKNMTLDKWNAVLNVNLKGAYNCCKCVIPHMIEKRSGRIINIASIVGQAGNVGQVNYAASKAGMIGLTKALARELAPKGINVNAVSPGHIKTDMIASIPDNIRKEILRNIPLGRAGTADEVADAVVFLASDMSEYITGQVINVNGGLYM